MKELKYFRRNETMPVQNVGSLCSDRPRAHVLPGAITPQPFTPLTVQPFNRLTFLTHHSSLAARLPSPKNIFSEERSQTLPVIIDDL
jgi:hypothetical protein